MDRKMVLRTDLISIYDFDSALDRLIDTLKNYPSDSSVEIEEDDILCVKYYELESLEEAQIREAKECKLRETKSNIARKNKAAKLKRELATYERLKAKFGGNNS